MSNYEYASYQFGSEARNIDVLPVRRPAAPYDGRRLMPVHDARVRKRKKLQKHMSLGYLLFYMIAATLSVLILVNYISLRSELQEGSKRISVLESRLNTMRQDNDEAYSRASGNLDLEEIKQIAIQEYGMVYAGEGQIVIYSDGGGDDSVRQLAPIPSSIR